MDPRTFGFPPTGESVEEWTLNGTGGLVFEVITYGGIVTRLLAPDRDGNMADVVLGFNNLDSYLAGHPYFGAITGRVAGRITGASINLEGETYQLARNDPPNHLHGGLQGFDKKIRVAAPVDAADGSVSVRLSYRSPDGEEGYPGTVNVAVIYTVTSDNIYPIETEADTDQLTPLNLTNHSYFNLAGEVAGSIADHVLHINADESVGTNEHITLLGRLESGTACGNDFRKTRFLGAAIPLLQSHGDLISSKSRRRQSGKHSGACRPPGASRQRARTRGLYHRNVSTAVYGCFSRRFTYWQIRCSLQSVRRRLPRMPWLSRRAQCSEPQRYHSASRTSAAPNHGIRFLHHSHRSSNQS